MKDVLNCLHLILKKNSFRTGKRRPKDSQYLLKIQITDIVTLGGNLNMMILEQSYNHHWGKKLKRNKRLNNNFYDKMSDFIIFIFFSFFTFFNNRVGIIFQNFIFK